MKHGGFHRHFNRRGWRGRAESGLHSYRLLMKHSGFHRPFHQRGASGCSIENAPHARHRPEPYHTHPAGSAGFEYGSMLPPEENLSLSLSSSLSPSLPPSLLSLNSLSHLLSLSLPLPPPPPHSPPLPLSHLGAYIPTFFSPIQRRYYQSLLSLAECGES